MMIFSCRELIIFCGFSFLIGMSAGFNIGQRLNKAYLKLVCEGLVLGFDCGDTWNKFMREAKAQVRESAEKAWKRALLEVAGFDPEWIPPYVAPQTIAEDGK